MTDDERFAAEKEERERNWAANLARTMAQEADPAYQAALAARQAALDATGYRFGNGTGAAPGQQPQVVVYHPPEWYERRGIDPKAATKPGSNVEGPGGTTGTPPPPPPPPAGTAPPTSVPPGGYNPNAPVIPPVITPGGVLPKPGDRTTPPGPPPAPQQPFPGLNPNGGTRAPPPNYGGPGGAKTYTGLPLRGYDPSWFIRSMREKYQGGPTGGQPYGIPQAPQGWLGNNLRAWQSVLQRG